LLQSKYNERVRVVNSLFNPQAKARAARARPATLGGSRVGWLGDDHPPTQPEKWRSAFSGHRWAAETPRDHGVECGTHEREVPRDLSPRTHHGNSRGETKLVDQLLKALGS
jgi:hypothetical protein